MLPSVLTFAFLSTAIFQTTTASNTVGTACASDAACSGPNEYCQAVTWLKPSCTTGICQCLPCYTTGDFTGYTWATNPCAPIAKLNIGDPCNADYFEYYVVKGSLCIDGKVACQQVGDIIKDGHCMRNGSALGEGKPCSHSVDCAGDLWCGLNYTCECFYSYQRFDTVQNACVKKDIGDRCFTDDDCKVSGRDWDGFTWSAAACVEGFCDCGPGNQKTMASYIDGLTGERRTRAICITGTGHVNITNDDQTSCTIDPVYYGDSDTVGVCSQEFVCASCPEENEWSFGKCRQVVAKKPPMQICSLNVTFIHENTTPLAPPASTVGKACLSNETCSGPNEICQEISWLSPSCSTSMCQCLPSYTNGINAPAILRGNTNPCAPVSVLSLGDSCDGAYYEYLSTPFSECAGGKVECKSGFLADWTDKCVAFLGSGEGGYCEYTFQCAGEMRCVSGNVCGCLYGYQKFNAMTGECVNKTHGDLCSANGDCKSVDDALACVNGVCGCGENMVTIMTSFIDPVANMLSNQSHCIPAKSRMHVLATGAECSPVNPVYISGTESSGVQACDKDQLCFSCPEDSSWTVGKCRKIVGTIPEPTWLLANYPEELTTELPTTAIAETTTEELTTVAPTTVAIWNALDECVSDASCLLANTRCVTTYCGRKCQCKEGYTTDESGVFCVPLRELKLNDTCSDSSIDERLPPHTVCKHSRVTCNSYNQRSTNGCVAVTQGTFGSRCGVWSAKCLASDFPIVDNDLWCDSSTRICRCYESLAYKWDSETDRCVKREYGDACSMDAECDVFGDLAGGGYTYGGAKCSTAGKCACSQNFVAASFTYLDAGTKLRTKTICVHRTAVTGLAPGAMCIVDPIFYGDNPLGQVRICRAGDVCVRCENDPAVNSISRRHGFCMSALP